MGQETEKQAVNRFAKAMHTKLIKRRGRYKEFGWRDPKYKSLQDLIDHLFSEIEEFQEFTNSTKEDMQELIDIANSAFILWDRLRIENDKKN